jgi:hypothetical protein
MAWNGANHAEEGFSAEQIATLLHQIELSMAENLAG